MFNNLKLANVIDKSGLKQRYLADMLGVSEVSVSRWVNGTRQPSPQNLAYVLRLCGFDDSELKSEGLFDWYLVNGIPAAPDG